MNLYQENVKKVVDLCSKDQLVSIMELKPEDAFYCAVHIETLNFLYYKEERNTIFVDYINGVGWQKAQHKDLQSLNETLSKIGFVLVNLTDLSQQQELTELTV